MEIGTGVMIASSESQARVRAEISISAGTGNASPAVFCLTAATNILQDLPNVALSSFVFSLLTLPFGASDFRSGC